MELSNLSGVPNQINTVRLANEIIELFGLSGVPITDERIELFDLSGVPNQINTVRPSNEIIELCDLSGVPNEINTKTRQ